MNYRLFLITWLFTAASLSSGLPLFTLWPSQELISWPSWNFFLSPTDKKFFPLSITRDDFAVWLEEQRRISFQKILNNIGGLGSELQGVETGAVIASPSKSNPDYFYQWVRDAAITMNSLIEYLQDNGFDDEEFHLQPVIESYIENAYYIQRVPNPSGSFEDLTGLGEPKFMVDNSPFEGNWGRPQRDGPGLRAITVANYLRLLHDSDKSIGNTSLLQDDRWIYFNVVKPDLQYVVRFWSNDGFDLWEEIYAKHLFTSLTQLRALQVGIRLLDKYQDDDFAGVLKQLFLSLRSFVEFYGFKNSNLPYLVETPSLLVKNVRSGLDIASILLSIRSHEIEDPDEALWQVPFDVNDPYVLNTLTALVNDMKYRYPINHKRLGLDQYIGMALGRYPEDVYNGNGISEGNPWFIATATLSEVLYKNIYQLYKSGEDVDLVLNPFFRRFLASGEAELVPFASGNFHSMALNLVRYADSFLDVIREHVDNSGSMSEQFNRYSGYMEGASDLTWSYGLLWSSFRWRDKVLEVMELAKMELAKMELAR